MPYPEGQLILIDSKGTRIEIDALIEKLRCDKERILADDEIGLILYVGDLDIYNLKPTDSGEFLAQRVTQLSRPRFHTRILRKQIGATVLSVSEDAIFIIREGQSLKKVRAEKLEPGMMLATGDKVFK